MVTAEQIEEREIVPHISKDGIRIEPLFRMEDGRLCVASILSFRDYRHRNRAVATIATHNPVAFHGWGVSGVANRVDIYSDRRFAFWDYKEGRPPGAKVPLLEPPKYAVRHVDWEAVHPDFRYLENPSELKKIWDSSVPFHVIFPYCQDTKTLSSVVVTPAFDAETASDSPYPTICIFWVEDPALKHLVKGIKDLDPEAQVGVSSLNKRQQKPSFTTPELIEYLRSEQIAHYHTIVEDPLLEPVDVASSHSQFVIPQKGGEPLWKVQRRGSLSPATFHKLTGFDIDWESAASAKVASRRGDPSEDIDPKVFASAHLIQNWGRWAPVKALFRIV